MNFLKKIRIMRHRQGPVPGYPRSIIIEPTNACNLKCRMCGVWGEEVRRTREVGFIREEVWRRALDEIGSWEAPVNVDLHGAGEPLLHPGLPDMLRHAKTKKNITVGFLCNAMLLDAGKSKAVLDIGVDWVGFSVDGAQAEIFEHYRRGAVLQKVEENIETLISMRQDGKPTIFLNMVAHAEADIDLFVRRWSGKVETLGISIKKPVQREKNTRFRLSRPCPLIYEQIVMGWNGKTGLCCEDVWGDCVTGEFPGESLLEIWRGAVFNKARKMHELGLSQDMSLCKTCDSSMFHRFEETIIGAGEKKTLVRKELPDIDAKYGGR